MVSCQGRGAKYFEKNKMDYGKLMRIRTQKVFNKNYYDSHQNNDWVTFVYIIKRFYKLDKYKYM